MVEEEQKREDGMEKEESMDDTKLLGRDKMQALGKRQNPENDFPYTDYTVLVHS